MRVAPKITLDSQEQSTLECWSRGRSTPSRLVARANIVLLAAQGLQNKAIASQLGLARSVVHLWRSRFAQQRIAGIEKDAPRGGRPHSIAPKIVRQIIDKTTQETPTNATHWSTRSLAEHVGVSHATVHRIWQANQLKPHLVRTFKLSNDPHFADKVVDIVGLYLDPPEHALVLSVDEKTQIQALDRTQKSLPFGRGRLGTVTHDYRRHGTTTLFAALEVTQGRLIGTCMPKHRHQEWIRFLGVIDTQTPAELDLHLIVDNYATHKHPQVQAWLKRHPRFHLHFTPTSSSWLNLVERWFREITNKRIRRGTFHNVAQLQSAIEAFIAQHNADPQSFTWTAKAEVILEKVRRARAVLDKSRTE